MYKGKYPYNVNSLYSIKDEHGARKYIAVLNNTMHYVLDVKALDYKDPECGKPLPAFEKHVLYSNPNYGVQKGQQLLADARKHLHKMIIGSPEHINMSVWVTILANRYDPAVMGAQAWKQKLIATLNNPKATPQQKSDAQEWLNELDS